MRRVTLSAVALLSVSMAAAGCGSTTIVRTVVERPASATISTPPSTAGPRAPSSRGTAPSAPSDGYTSCDSNIEAKAGSTSCGFAENVFYEYYVNGGGTFDAYSPATQTSYSIDCSGSDPIDCTAGDGAEVRFPQAAVDAYTQDEADHYAATHDTGPGGGSDPSAPSPGPAPAPSTPSDCNGADPCPPRGPSGADGTYNCSDFDTQQQAQQYFDQVGDIDGLDANHDGVPCQSLP